MCHEVKRWRHPVLSPSAHLSRKYGAENLPWNLRHWPIHGWWANQHYTAWLFGPFTFISSVRRPTHHCFDFSASEISQRQWCWQLISHACPRILPPLIPKFASLLLVQHRGWIRKNVSHTAFLNVDFVWAPWQLSHTTFLEVTRWHVIEFIRVLRLLLIEDVKIEPNTFGRPKMKPNTLITTEKVKVSFSFPPLFTFGWSLFTVNSTGTACQ